MTTHNNRNSKLREEGLVLTQVRFSEDDTNKIRQAAIKAGMSTPKYMQAVILERVNAPEG